MAGLRQLCGWRRASQIPHESKFSRAFAQFPAMQEFWKWAKQGESI
jgi:hypothetical protein